MHFSSSSFYWASVANAPKVLQPYWLIVLPLDFPNLTASLLLWSSSGQRWCLRTFSFSNVPTFATSRLQEILAAKGGTTWSRNGRWILPENALLPRNIQGSFTCRKSTTRDKRLYFPSERRHAEDFFALKNPTVSARFEPANLGTKGQHKVAQWCWVCELTDKNIIPHTTQLWIEPRSLDPEDSHQQPALWRDGFDTDFWVSCSPVLQEIRASE